MFTRTKPNELPVGESPRDSLMPPAAGTNPLSKPPARPSESLLTPQQVAPPKRPSTPKPILETRKPTEPTPAPAENEKLIVGRGISLNGRIAACDRLIVEGKVEAALQDCHTLSKSRKAAPSRARRKSRAPRSPAITRASAHR